MSAHLKVTIAYAILVLGLIVISFGPLTDWQSAASNLALVSATAVILLIPSKKAS